MKRLNGQLLTDSNLRASSASPRAIVNETQTIQSDKLPFGYDRVESNNAQQVLRESPLSGTYKKLNKVQQQRWRALSVFPHQFDCAAAAALWKMKEQQKAETVLKALEAEELVFSTPSLSENSPRYMLNDSARLFASARLNSHEHEEALFHHAKHYKEVLQQAALLYEQGGKELEHGMALFEQEWPNIQAGQFWSADYAAQNQKAATLCREYQKVGGYMLLVGLDNEEWLAWQEAAVMATQYLHQHQNRAENEPIEQQMLNSDAVEVEEEQPDAQISLLEELHTKALRLADEAAANLEEGQLELAIESYKEQLAIVRRLDDEAWEAKLHYQLANAYYLLDEIELAIELYQQSCVMMHKNGDLNGEASSLIGLGNAYAELAEWEEAIDVYESSLQTLHHNQITEPHLEAYLFEELGNAYELLGDLPRAITFYERQLACASQLEENESQSRALTYLGKAYHKSRQPERAIGYYKQQLAMAQKAGNQPLETKTLGLLGRAYAELGEYQAAIGYYQQQLSLLHELEMPHEEESTLWYLGLAHHKAGQIREAIECYEQQLAIARQLGKTKEEVDTLEYLGLAYHKLSQVQQAMDCHQQQFKMAHELEDWSSKARALEYLGLIYAELDQLPQAINCFEQQLAIVSMFESRQTEARILAYLANAVDLQGEHSRAVKFYQQALQLNRALEDKEEEASNLWHISLALSQQGKIETAIKYAETSQAIYEQLQHPQANKISDALKQWQQTGTFGMFVNAFKRTLRTNLFATT